MRTKSTSDRAKLEKVDDILEEETDASLRKEYRNLLRTVLKLCRKLISRLLRKAEQPTEAYYTFEVEPDGTIRADTYFL